MDYMHPSNEYYIRQRDHALAWARRLRGRVVILWALLGIAVFTDWDEHVRDWLTGAWATLLSWI